MKKISLLVACIAFNAFFALNSSPTDSAAAVPPGSYLQTCKSCTTQNYSNGYQLTCQCPTGEKTGFGVIFGFGTPTYKETSIYMADITNNKGVLEAVPFKAPTADAKPSFPVVGPIL